MHEITELLRRWGDGDEEALNKLMPLVQEELKKIARRYMSKERPGHILQPTALVNEAWIKLMPKNITWENRRQFYGFVARRMWQTLVDYAREEQALKRGKRPELVELNEAKDKVAGKSEEMLKLDEALKELAEFDERLMRVVECRYFIGLSLGETAKVIDTSTATVDRDWRFARDWLKSRMIGGQSPA